MKFKNIIFIKMKIKKNINLYSNKHFSRFSDLIINEILDKIILLSIYESENKNLNSKIPEFCFKFSENILTNIFSWNFISFDKDDKRIEDNLLKNNAESQKFQYNNNISHILSNNNENISYLQMCNKNISNKYWP